MKSNSKPIKLVNLKRLRFYLLTFVIVLGLLATLTSFWKSLDYIVYKSIYLTNSKKISIRPDISIVDLPYIAEGDKKFNLESFRARLSNLLLTVDSLAIGGNTPKAVILDLYFSEEEVSDSVGLGNLKESVEILQNKKIEVYGVYDMDFDDDRTFETHDATQAQIMYETLTGFRLHSIIEEMWKVLSYKSVIKMPKKDGGFELIDALPVKAAADLNPSPEEASITEERSYILPMGKAESLVNQTYSFTHKEGEIYKGEFSKDFELDSQILIIGSFDGDETNPKLDKKAPQIGTKLLAWALNDQLENNILAKQPLNSVSILIGMVVFFALFVVLIFGAIYKYIKSFQTKPNVIAIVSFVIGTICLLLFGFAYLASNVVIPVGLTILAMLVSSVLAWHFSKKFLVAGIAEGSGKYDVFISYSHGDGDWVKKNIYKPLSEFKKEDGSALNIFFDEKSIGVGEAFTIKYMKAIVDSKIFVPIMSEEYYNKNHCRNEMDIAVKRNIEKLMKLFPIVFNFSCVPEHYNHILVTDITVKEDYLEALKQELA